MEISDIKKVFFVPDHDKYTPVKDEEAEFMYNLINENKLKNTLEVGLGYGKSALYILCGALKHNKNVDYKHIVMDPFQSKYNYGAIANFKKLHDNTKSIRILFYLKLYNQIENLILY